MRILVAVAGLAALVAAAGGTWGAPDTAPAAGPAASSNVAAAPAVSAEFEKDIRKLLEVSRMAEMSKAGISRNVAQYKTAMPDVPAEFWTRLEAKLDGQVNDLLTQLVPIYARNLSAEDVKSLIQFYESPLGQRFVAAQPKISAEAAGLAQAWGRTLAAQIMAEIQAEQAKAAPKSGEAPAEAPKAPPEK